MPQVETLETLHTLLTFKTIKCVSFDHYKPQTEQHIRAIKKECRFFHDELDRRRPLLSQKAMAQAQHLSSTVSAVNERQVAIEETNETSPNLKSNGLQNVRAASEQGAMVTPEILYLVLQMTLSMTRQSNIDEMLTY